jgi:ribokinase
LKCVVVVGSINLDLVAVAPKIPRAGETLTGSAFQTFPGGKGANQAVAAARLGAAVSMIGNVGSDDFGRQLKSNLQECGVDVKAVLSVPGPSGIALITTDAQGENAITVIAGANGAMASADLENNIDVIRNAGILLTQLEIPIETVIHLGEIACREGIPLMLDPAPAQNLPSALFKNVDWLTPNETEACSLLRIPGQQILATDMKSVADRLRQLGSRNVILKLGSRGCFLALEDGTQEIIPAHAVRAIDSTAAGDAFNGAFAAELLEGKSPVESAHYASAVAAISVTRNGAQPSMPTRAEVNEFYSDKLATNTAN